MERKTITAQQIPAVVKSEPLPPTNLRTAERNQIDAQMQQFLAGGGEITHLPNNLARNPTYSFDRSGYLQPGQGSKRFGRK